MRSAESLGVTQPELYDHVRGGADCHHALPLLVRQQQVAKLRDAEVVRAPAPTRLPSDRSAPLAGYRDCKPPYRTS
jgi:hypothetical protein